MQKVTGSFVTDRAELYVVYVSICVCVSPPLGALR